VQVTANAAPALDLTQRVFPFSLWKCLVGIALAGVLLYLALHGVDWRSAFGIVAHCRLNYLALACGCSVISYWLRAMRWRLLLTAQERLAPATVLWANSVGYLVNLVIPARAGEVVRSVMISSRSALSKTYVLTTAMAERVIELLVLISMALLMSFNLALKPLWLSRLLVAIFILTCGGILFVLALPLLDRAGIGFIAWLKVGSRTQVRLRSIAKGVVLAVTTLRNPWRLTKVCAYSVCVWMLDATAAVILAHALGMRLVLAVAVLLSAALALGNAVPSTPGAIGVFQFVGVSVLVPFNFTQTQAATYILIAQAATCGVVTSLGLVGLWRYRATGSVGE
jgi:uncharacterized protein (TIRG00374 family)